MGNSVKVSPLAVARFLTRHKFLLTLEFDNMREVLVCLGDMGLASTYQSNLRKLVLESCREDMERVLEEVIECLPLLEALSFNNSDLNLVLLSPVSRLSHLSKLELGNSPSTQLTASFQESVLPILNIIGGQITHISLENFKFFDVTSIGRYCPKLVSLKLSNILSYCRAENQKIRSVGTSLKS